MYFNNSTTHSNINTSNISKLFHNNSLQTYQNILLPIFNIFHSFSKKFIDPLHLRLFFFIYLFINNTYNDELLRFL